MWIRFCPDERLLFRIEKTIDDNGVTLSRISPARSRGFTIHYVWSTFYGDTLRIMKHNLVAIGNFLWINCAMSVAQPCAVPRPVRPLNLRHASFSGVTGQRRKAVHRALRRSERDVAQWVPQEHRKVEEQDRKLEEQATLIAKQQQQQIETLAAGLEKVNEQMEASKLTPQVVLKDC
jgi:hypothetical protein